MKFFLLFLLVSLCGIAQATDYYVSTSGNNSNNGTSQTTPWQTLSKVETYCNNGTIKAGDKILFKKGDQFTGTFFMTNLWGHNGNSGTATNPITFSSYGTGAKPLFQYPQGGSVITEERIILWFIGVNYIVIDGLNFTDLVAPTNNKVSAANCGFAIYIGIQEEATSNHCTVKNVDISLCGMGIAIVGDFNTVTNSTLTNFKNLKNTSGGQDDYGATAITITGNDNQILNNYIASAWAYSSDFGWNGGACEMYNTCNRNKFMYNTFVDCEGISEYGGQNGNSAADNLYAYNKIINSGQLIWINTTGSFAMQVSNIQYFNNVIVENSLSRFSGPNVGAGNSHPQAQYPSQQLFAYDGTPSAPTVFNLKNNIFQLSTGIDIVNTSHASKTTHQDNIYKLTGGGVTNFSLATSELATSAAVLTSTTDSDPVLWNYTPVTAGPAIDFGQNVGIPKDFAGNTVPSVPNAGILESASAPPSTLAASSSAGTISCNGGTTTVTVSATGGTTPYTGTGTFTITAGTYTYSVTDAVGTVKTTSITITQPTALAASVAAPNVSSPTATTTATVTASGGTAAYSYKLNAGAYQASNVFANVAAGNHTISVKDAKGCILSKAFTVSVTQSGPLVVTATAGTIACNGGTATVTVTASGGRAPYSGTGTFTASAGARTYTVTDANGTTASKSLTLVQPSKITAPLTKGTINVYGGSTTVTVNAAGGTAPYTYKLNSGAYQSSKTFTNVYGGSNTITVKDSRGCLKVRTFNLSQPSAGRSGGYEFASRSIVTPESDAAKDQIEMSGFKVLAFPNPTTTEFSLLVETSSRLDVKILVMNVQGQKVYEGTRIEHENTVFGRNFMPGIYIVKVQQGNTVETIKVIKTKY